MAIFERAGKKRAARWPFARKKIWWETANEFHPETLYDPESDYDPEGDFSFDPLGSYTGVPEDGTMPIQDADDL